MTAPEGAERAAASERWLYGPWLDLGIGCGVGYLVLVPALLAVGRWSGATDWPLIAAAIFGILINTPHYGATVVRVYAAAEDRAKYRFFALHATLALAIVFAGASRSVWLSSALITLYVTWSPWHFAGQNYGLALMFLRRRGVHVDPLTKRLFHASFVLSALLAMLAIHGQAARFAVTLPTLDAPGAPGVLALPIPSAWLPALLAVAATAYVACLCVATWRLSRESGFADPLPAWCLVATQALWFAVPAVFGVHALPFAAVWVSTAHSAQYLWVTAYYAGRSAGAAPPGRFLAQTLVAGTAVTVIPGLLFAPDLLGVRPWDAGLAITTFAIVNLHHFVLDGAIWKLRDGRIARVLLRSAPADPEPVRARSSPLRVAVWGAAALSLSVPAVATWEDFVGIPRADGPERVDRAVQRLRWIGRESASLQLAVGRAKERHGLDDAALEHYHRAVALFPFAEPWIALADLHTRRGERALALDAVLRAVELAPGDAGLQLRRARLTSALAQSGERPDPGLRETAAALRRALSLDPGNPIATLHLARIEADAGRRDAAIALLERALSVRAGKPSPKLRRALRDLRRLAS